MQKNVGIHPFERPLFVLAFIISTLVWIPLIISIVGILYAVAIWLSIIAGNAIFLATIRGNGIKVGPNQYPEIHQLAQHAAEKMQLEHMPDIYIYNMNGLFNAFAANIFARDFVILTSDMLDRCESSMDKLYFVIAHEFGHVKRHHNIWRMFLAPALWFPWLGTAYSRACEYTCDGLAAVECGIPMEHACRCCAVLATASAARADKLNLEAYRSEQYERSGSFWMSVAEGNSTHPFTVRRVAWLRQILGAEKATARSNFFGLLLAPLFNFQTWIAVYVIVIMISIFSQGIAAFNRQRQAVYSSNGIGSDYTVSDPFGVRN